MEIVIAGQSFRTKKDLGHKVREMLHDRQVGIELDAEDHEFLLALLLRHPSADEKIGAGVEAFRISISQYNNRFFEIRRSDDTWDDFSYTKCISGKQDSWLESALKEAVEQQVEWALENTFGWDEEILCAVSGERITRETARAQYDPPITWQEIYERFLASEAIDPARIPSRKSVDQALFERWKTFHETNAKYRVVTLRTG